MKVLMLGWEFPPFFAGGVGVVCEALTRSLAARGNDVTFIMPHGTGSVDTPVRLLATGASPMQPGGRIAVGRIASSLHSYAATAGPAGAQAANCRAVEVASRVAGDLEARRHTQALYGPDLLEEIDAFAMRAAALIAARDLEFDVIHAHDWTTFRAGLAIRKATGRPLIVHVHITEFDKSGGAWADPDVYALEREGLHGADLVICVSERIRRTCIERYGAAPERTRVIYNGIDSDDADLEGLAVDSPLVLFLGRVTLQKGPQYFLEAAARVCGVESSARFVMAGTGDMLPAMIERAAELGIGDRVLFPGFVCRRQAAVLYRSADVFVMPSVSEPFGIVPLEAMDQAVPTIVSRQSGVAEVVRNALKVDFWDVEDMAAKILAALRYRGLQRELAANGSREASRMSWASVAARMENTYREILDA